MTEQILRKEISRIVEGDKEIVTNELHKKDDFITKEELTLLDDIFSEDNETAHDNGVIYGYDYDCIYIEIDKLLKYIDGLDEEEDGEFGYITLKELGKKISEYKGFDIWM